MVLETELGEVRSQTEHCVSIEVREKIDWDMGDKRVKEKRYIVCSDCNLVARDAYHFKSNNCT